eukprot:SAG22_NODE_858_length_6831_cov_25.965538_5_plen_66_part_00
MVGFRGVREVGNAAIGPMQCTRSYHEPAARARRTDFELVQPYMQLYCKIQKFHSVYSLKFTILHI